MPVGSVADAWLRLRVDDEQVAKDVKRGVDKADTGTAGQKAGERYGTGFSKGADRGLARLRREQAATRKEAAKLGGEVNKLTGHLFGYGDATTVGSRKATIFTRVLAGVNLATGLAEPLVSSLVVATGGLAASFTAAGAGLGAYGLALLPFIQNQKKATQLQAQAAAGNKAARQQLKQLLDESPPAFRTFNTEVGNATSAYKAWSMSLATPVLTPLTTGLKVVKPALAALTPLVKAAAGAIGTLIGELAAKIQGGGLERVVTTLLPHVRTNLVNLGHVIGNVVSGIWGIIKAFVPFSETMSGGLVTLTRHFSDWANTLTGRRGFHAIVQQWRDDWPVIKPVLENLGKLVRNILSALAGMATPSNSKALWQIANPLMALAVSLSSHPVLVRTLLYLTLIGKGAGQLRGVFGAMQSAWTVLGGTLAKLTGGRLGWAAQGATVAAEIRAAFVSGGAAAAAEIRAAMATGGAVAGAEGAAGAGAAGAAGAGAAGAGAISGGLAAAMGVAGGVAAAAWILRFRTDLHRDITTHLIPDIGKWFSDAGRGLGGFFAGAADIMGQAIASKIPDWGKQIRKGLDITNATAKANTALQGTAGLAGRANNQARALAGGFNRASGAASALAGGARSLVPPLDDLRGKQQAVARQGGAVASTFDRQKQAAGPATAALNDYTASIHTNGLRSKETHAARDRLVNDMITAGVKGRVARRDVDRYTEAIRENGFGSTQARAARQRLIDDISTAFQRSQQGKRDMTRYTDAVRINGQKSDVAKAARRQLIQDLINSGLTAKEARTLVNKLTGAVKGIPSKAAWHLFMRGTGAWTVKEATRRFFHTGANPSGFALRAAGGPVRGPGTGTSDTAGLFALSNREYVIKAASARKYGEEALAAVNSGTAQIGIPRMARGGLVLQGNRDVLTGKYARDKYLDTFTGTKRETLHQMWREMLSQMRAAVMSAWPFPGGKKLSELRRIDEGQDMQYPGTNKVPVLAILPGHVIQFGGDPGGFGSSYPGLRLDSPAMGFSQIYYGHTWPIGKTGRHVMPGEAIGRTGGATSQGDAAGLPNWLEIGFWPPSWANGPAMHRLLLHGLQGGAGAARGGSWTVGGMARLWQQVGGAANLAHLMAAIGMAESGGRAWIRNPSGASGLWQIMMPANAWAVDGNVFNPLVNARAARVIYNVQGLRAWEAYTNGSYRQFYDNGGMITEPILGLGMQTGRQYGFSKGEAVNPEPDRTADLLAAACDLLAQIPGATGAAVADALDGVARRGSYRGAYSAR